MAASRPSMRVLSSHDALKCFTRQLNLLDVRSGSCSIAAGGIRNFSKSCNAQAEEQQAQASTSESSALPPLPSTSQSSKPSLASIIKASPAAAPSASSPQSRAPRLPVTPPTPGRRSVAFGRGRQSYRSGAPYRLHAHCSKHNTILALTKDLPPSSEELMASKDAPALLGALSRGQTVEQKPVDAKILGQTVLRVSPGMLGLKKAQRGTFEAASRASVQMFNLIAQLGSKERTNKEGQRIKDEQVGSVELILKGFGQGREALVAAINSSQGDEVRRKIYRITDATPIKIGGTRPKKRRKLSPPLDLSRRRK